MIHKKEESEVEVTWEDQTNINTFGKLNLKFHELENELKIKKEEINNVEDASNELLLIDEEIIKFKIGEVYVDITKEEAEKLLEQQELELNKEIEIINEKIEKIKKNLEELKIKLYGKFGNSINLEEE